MKAGTQKDEQSAKAAFTLKTLVKSDEIEPLYLSLQRTQDNRRHSLGST